VADDSVGSMAVRMGLIEEYMLVVQLVVLMEIW